MCCRSTLFHAGHQATFWLPQLAAPATLCSLHTHPLIQQAKGHQAQNSLQPLMQGMSNSPVTTWQKRQRREEAQWEEYACPQLLHVSPSWAVMGNGFTPHYMLWGFSLQVTLLWSLKLARKKENHVFLVVIKWFKSRICCAPLCRLAGSKDHQWLCSSALPSRSSREHQNCIIKHSWAEGDGKKSWSRGHQLQHISSFQARVLQQLSVELDHRPRKCCVTVLTTSQPLEDAGWWLRNNGYFAKRCF